MCNDIFFTIGGLQERWSLHIRLRIEPHELILTKYDIFDDMHILYSLFRLLRIDFEVNNFFLKKMTVQAVLSRFLNRYRGDCASIQCARKCTYGRCYKQSILCNGTTFMKNMNNIAECQCLIARYFQNIDAISESSLLDRRNGVY